MTALPRGSGCRQLWVLQVFLSSSVISSPCHIQLCCTTFKLCHRVTPSENKSIFP
jgi:hypothetical protein